MKHIVILGGSHAGISVAHRILKHGGNVGKCKITMITPNTHHYWNLASPRGVIPDEIPDGELFQPIAPGFAHYPKGQFELALATAESVDFDAKKVEIRENLVVKTITYDFLIIATGARSSGNMPFKTLDSTEATKNALHELQRRIGEAKSIVVAGAGVTGVEVSAELGFKYGWKKEITLISGTATILDGVPDKTCKVATKGLEQVNVKIMVNKRIAGSTELLNGQYEVKFQDGGKLTTDVYIPAFGFIPNSSYIPVKYLHSTGFVMVDQYQKVKGTEDVWALGDIADIEPPQYKHTVTQSEHLGKNIALILAKKTPVPYKVETSRFVGFSLGRNNGTGYWGNWKLPSWLITYVRKKLFIDQMEPMINGSLY